MGFDNPMPPMTVYMLKKRLFWIALPPALVAFWVGFYYLIGYLI